MTCDVLVVGAGPAGSMAARTTASLGLRTALLEEHPEVGCPTHCTGKLSVHAFRRFALPASLIQSALSAAALYAPDGTVARVRRATVDSYVVDRDPFDRYLADRASQAGAEVITGARARTVAREHGRLHVDADRRGARTRFTASLVIDAEGANPVLPPQLGIAPRRTLVHGLQYEVEGVDLEADDAPALYFGREVAPGFFAWLMPVGPDRGRLGLAVDPRQTDRPPVYFLERLMATHPAVTPRVRRARIVRKLAGRIPILGLRRPTWTDGMLVIGDAAGQVKATSGGGIYFSMLAGELAGRAAAAFLAGGPHARGALPAYEADWQDAFGREVRFTTVVRQALNRLSDRHINTVIRALATDADLRRAVEEHGDTQYQSRLLRPVLTAAARASLRDWSLAPTVVAALGAGMLALWSDGEGREGRRAAKERTAISEKAGASRSTSIQTGGGS
ncbi:MAG: NAD(P)/FAD-dependent oxidoreductase [Armatimonadota bacterium]|nr:NAD(P)/FAD-dependent oxidoreductase [Armatimonadota bacterium]